MKALGTLEQTIAQNLSPSGAPWFYDFSILQFSASNPAWHSDSVVCMVVSLPGLLVSHL